MEYDAPGPFEKLKIKNHLIRVTRLSFDIKLDGGDTIHASFSHRPLPGEVALVDYSSKKGGGGMLPLEGMASAEPSELARALLTRINRPLQFTVTNIESDYADLFIPSFVQNGPVTPYGSGIGTETTRIKGAVLIADLRGFSAWEATAPPESVQMLFEVFSERVAQMQLDNAYNYWKLLGDGVMLVWEDGKDGNSIVLALDAAFALHKHYWYFLKESQECLPAGFGIAVAGGWFTRYRSKTFFESVVIQDYLGALITWASRVQALARPGEVLVNSYVARGLHHDWYSTSELPRDRVDGESLKGVTASEHEIHRVHHKYFNDLWESFTSPT